MYMEKIKVNEEYPNNLRFAKDIVRMSESTDEMQQMFLQLHRESQKVDSKMNMKKTTVRCNNFIPDHEIKIIMK